MIKCTYEGRDRNGPTEYSCFPDVDDEPTFVVSKSRCDRGTVERQATITYQICSYNNKDFFPNPETNFIKYSAGESLRLRTSSIIDPPGWDDPLDKYNHSSSSPSCKTETEKRTLRLCEDEVVGMAISMDGQLDRSHPNYCQCSLEELFRSEVRGEEVNGKTDEPTASPTKSPVVVNRQSLLARIKNLGDDYPDLSGVVQIEKEEDGADLIINYDIRNGPEMCDDCKIGVFHGSSCNELYDSFYDPDKTANPWTVMNGAHIVSNNRGNAAAFINVFNGRGLRRHTCKLFILYFV